MSGPELAEELSKGELRRLDQHFTEIYERFERASEIVEYAEEGGFDLVVMSSRRFDPEERSKNWATVSHKVAIMARTPVLLVK